MKNLCKHFSGGVIFEKPATKFVKGTFFSLLLAACTTFTACNNEESLPSQGNQLQLSFGVNAPESRAIHKDATLPDNSPVGVKLDGYADYANLVYKGTTTGGTQAWALTEGSVTLTDTKGTIYAYWPYSSTTSIDAIDVDMTTADQTDWLYATPVTGICEDKAEAAVTMNHAAANINVTINKGTYLGSGAISNITLQSEGIALGGTFNAAQATPDYTAFEDEGKPLSRDLTTTTGAATDIMVVPTGTSAAITFTATIDGIQFTATSAAVKVEKGNSYVYTLNLSDISTYMEISGFSVKQWNSVNSGSLELKEDKSFDLKTAPNGVYAVTAEGKGMNVEDADNTCIAVAYVMGDHRFMIEKAESILTWGKNLVGEDVPELINYETADGTNGSGYLSVGPPTQLNKDFTTWKAGALSDFNGKNNTAAIIAGYAALGKDMDAQDMCKVLETHNEGGYTDWYVPAFGQLALMYLAMTDINEALDKIGGAAMVGFYWSSTEKSTYLAWGMDFMYGNVNTDNKGRSIRVRFVRDIAVDNKPAAPVINSAGKANGVYVVTKDGELVDKSTEDPTALGVALITNKQRILIEKNGEANTDIIKAAYDADAASNTDYKKFYWGPYGIDVTGIENILSADAAKADFSGKANTAVIIATPDTDSSTTYANMGTYCTKFNEMCGTYSDWYIPAAGQLYEIYTNMTDINAALAKIGGTKFKSDNYWSSSEKNSSLAWLLYFVNGTFDDGYKNEYGHHVRFVRDIN